MSIRARTLRRLLVRRTPGERRGPSPEELEALARRPLDWPRSCFFICGGPRTGTTLLAGLLASSRRVGLASEYFKETKEPAWAAGDYAEFISFTKRLHAIDGVFGAKLLWRDLQHVLKRLRDGGADPEVADRALLDAAFDQPRFIWSRRRDAVAQGVSWWKADLTGVWSSVSPPEFATGRAVDFDFEQIDQRVRLVREGDAAWGAWFAAAGIEPFPVVYEELVRDLAGSARTALAFLGIDVASSIELRPRVERQFDGVNALFISRYRELADARSVPPCSA